MTDRIQKEEEEEGFGERDGREGNEIEVEMIERTRSRPTRDSCPAATVFVPNLQPYEIRKKTTKENRDL